MKDGLSAVETAFITGLLHMQQQCDVENKVEYSLKKSERNYAATRVNFNGVRCVTRSNGTKKCSGKQACGSCPCAQRSLPSQAMIGIIAEIPGTQMQGVPILPGTQAYCL